MGTNLDSIRVNEIRVKINEIDIETLIRCAKEEYISIKKDEHIEIVHIFGVYFLFNKGRLSYFSIVECLEEYKGKVFLIDYCGNEIDIQDKYNLVSMMYCDISAHYVKGNNVSPYVTINDYDNIECKICINRSGITLMYDILNSIIVNSLSNKLGQLVSKRKRYRTFNEIIS